MEVDQNDTSPNNNNTNRGKKRSANHLERPNIADNNSNQDEAKKNAITTVAVHRRLPTHFEVWFICILQKSWSGIGDVQVSGYPESSLEVGWVQLGRGFFSSSFFTHFFLVIFQALALLRSVVLASAQRNQQRSKSEIERSEELTRVEREHLSEEKSGRLSTIESTGTLGDDDLDVDLDESCSDSEDVFEHPQ